MWVQRMYERRGEGNTGKPHPESKTHRDEECVGEASTHIREATLVHLENPDADLAVAVHLADARFKQHGSGRVQDTAGIDIFNRENVTAQLRKYTVEK